MAIPLSDKRTQVQAPRVASGRAVMDLEGLRNVGAPALETAVSLIKAVDTGKKMADTYQSNKDAIAANDAATEYQERLQFLNDELNQKQGQNRIDALPEYNAEAAKAHNKFISQIDKVKTANIREQYRQHINAINLRNQTSYDWENYKTKENLDAQTTQRFINTELDRLTQQTTPYDGLESTLRRLADPNLGLKAGQDAIKRWYGEHMGLPEDVVQGYIENFNTTAINNVATRMNEYEAELGYKDNFSNAINLVKFARDNKIITEGAYRQIARPIETQKLDYYVNTYPEKFIDGLGRYKDSLAHQIAPDLNIEERRRAVHMSANGSGAGAGAGLQNDLSEFTMEDIENLLIQNGLAEFMPTSRRELYRNVTENTQKDRRKQLGALAPIRILRAVDLYRNTYFVMENGNYRQLKPGENIAQLQQKGYQLVKGADRKDLQDYKIKAASELLRMADTGEFSENARQKLFGANKNITMEESLAMSLIGSFSDKMTKSDSGLFRALRKFGEWSGLRDVQDTRILSEYEVSEIIRGAFNGAEMAARKKGIDLGQRHDSYLGTKVNFMDEKGNITGTEDTYGYLLSSALTSAAANLPIDVLQSLQAQGKDPKEYITGGKDLTKDFTDPFSTEAASRKFGYKYSPEGLFLRSTDALLDRNDYKDWVSNQERNKRMFWSGVSKAAQAMRGTGVVGGYIPSKERMIEMTKNVPFKDDTKESFQSIANYISEQVSNAENPKSYEEFINDTGYGTYEAYKKYLSDGMNIGYAWNLLDRNEAFKPGNSIEMYRADSKIVPELADISARTTLTGGVLSQRNLDRMSAILRNKSMLGKPLVMSADTKRQPVMRAEIPNTTILFTNPDESYIIGKDQVPHRIDMNSNQLYYMVGLQNEYPQEYETRKSNSTFTILPDVEIGQDFR